MKISSSLETKNRRTRGLLLGTERIRQENKATQVIEVIIENDVVVISWNDMDIQEMAEDIGEPEFPESRPCG